MRLLIDNDLSWRLARALRQAGHDSAHVADRALDQAPDAAVVQAAIADRRVIITRDGDFGPIVAASGLGEPSVVQLRTTDGRPSAEAAVLIDLLPRLEPDLLAGAFVVVEDQIVRIKSLK